MILYRLEHKESGLGPWAHGREKSRAHMGLMFKEQERKDMPAPPEDGLGWPKHWDDSSNQLFGFTSQAKMLRYYSLEFLTNLVIHYGFVIKELQVSECVVGRRGFQARFHRGAIVYNRIIMEDK